MASWLDHNAGVEFDASMGEYRLPDGSRLSVQDVMNMRDSDVYRLVKEAWARRQETIRLKQQVATAQQQAALGSMLMGSSIGLVGATANPHINIYHDGPFETKRTKPIAKPKPESLRASLQREIDAWLAPVAHLRLE